MIFVSVSMVEVIARRKQAVSATSLFVSLVAPHYVRVYKYDMILPAAIFS